MWAGMRLRRMFSIMAAVSMALALLQAPFKSRAASCTTQAELGSLDRDALATIADRLAYAVTGQDFATLQAELLPQEASEWQGIRLAVEQAAPLVKGGQFQLRNLYLLDASSQTAP